MKDLGALMKQAQAMQQKLTEAQARLAETTADGAPAPAWSSVTLKGSGELVRVSIDDVAAERRRGRDRRRPAHRRPRRRQAQARRRPGRGHAGRSPARSAACPAFRASSDLGGFRRTRDRAADRAARQAAGARAPLGPALGAGAAQEPRPAAAAAGPGDGRGGRPGEGLLDLRRAGHHRPLRHLRRRGARRRA